MQKKSTVLQRVIWVCKRPRLPYHAFYIEPIDWTNFFHVFTHRIISDLSRSIGIKFLDTLYWQIISRKINYIVNERFPPRSLVFVNRNLWFWDRSTYILTTQSLSHTFSINSISLNAEIHLLMTFTSILKS